MTRLRTSPRLVVITLVALAAMAASAQATPAPRAPGDLSWSVSLGTAVPRTFAGLSAADTHGTAIAAVGSASTYGIQTDPYWGPPLLERDGLIYLLDAGDGQVVWSKTYAGATDTWQDFNAVTFSPDGTRVFVTGEETPRDSHRESAALVLAFDAASGDLLWDERFGDGTRFYWGNLIQVTPDGATVVVGGSEWDNGFEPVHGRTGGHFLTMTLDAQTGAMGWAKEFQHKVGLDIMDQLNGMALSPDGTQVVVTGMSNRLRRGLDYATFAYDMADGHRVWSAWYDGFGGGSGGSNQDIAEGIVYAPDGSQVVVTGYAGSRNRGYEIATLGYGATDGQREWLARYDGPAPGTTSDIPTGIVFADDGSTVFITGDDQRYVSTVAYDPANGSRRWVSVRSTEDGRTRPSDGLVVSPSDGALLMGGQLGPKADPTAAMALDPIDGSQLWAAPPPDGNVRFGHMAATADALVLVGSATTKDPVTGNASIPAIASYDTTP